MAKFNKSPQILPFKRGRPLIEKIAWVILAINLIELALIIHSLPK